MSIENGLDGVKWIGGMNVGEKEEYKDDRTEGATVASGEKEEYKDDRTEGATRRGIERAISRVSGGRGGSFVIYEIRDEYSQKVT